MPRTRMLKGYGFRVCACVGGGWGLRAARLTWGMGFLGLGLGEIDGPRSHHECPCLCQNGQNQKKLVEGFGGLGFRV